jgi:predicted DNA-binding transcriptional regulator AlpA
MNPKDHNCPSCGCPNPGKPHHEPVKLSKAERRALVASQGDGFLDLSALEVYTGLSRSLLQSYIKRPIDPLPSYMTEGNGKTLVLRSEYDDWAERNLRRLSHEDEIDEVVSEVLRKLQN